MMRKSFKYRLWTNANQERELSIMLETHRRLYNECLSLREMAWQCCGANVNYYDCSRWYKAQRRINQFFARTNYSSAQWTIARLERAFEGFFRRCRSGAVAGYPRFGSQSRFNSICFKDRDGVRLIGDRLRVQYVGDVRVKLHRPVAGKIKNVTIKREAGKWYVIFACELPSAPTASSGPPVGVDVGLESFLTTSDGDHVPSPRYLKSALPRLRRASRSVARKRLGSKSRSAAVTWLVKMHARLKNLRREHHHQTALKLVRRYGLIAVESLNIQGMVRNRRFSQAISDAGWSGFLLTLRHKAESAGVAFVEVDPKGTSQQCVCGQEVKKDLSVRWHDCPSCGLSLHRDHVAAKVILARGLAARTGPPQANVGRKAKRPARSRRQVGCGVVTELEGQASELEGQSDG